MKNLIIILLIFSFQANGKIKNSRGKQLNKIKNLNYKLSEQNSKVLKIAAEITTLEKKLGKSNNLYLKKMEQLKEIRQRLEEASKELISNKDSAVESYNSSQKIYEQYLLSNVDDVEIVEDMYEGEVLDEALGREIDSLKDILQENENLNKQVNFLKNKVSQLKKDEDSLYKLIMELESKKKQRAEVYIKEISLKQQLENDLETRKRAFKKTKRKKLKHIKTVKSDLLFGLPMKKFTKSKIGKKGITLFYKGKQSVLSTADGKVVYSGKLSTYGNLVMIEHNNKLRSVILGDYEIKVKKNDKVKAGQVIGTGAGKLDEKKSVYFELRKNNDAQKTIQWLNKQSLDRII
jgi:murein DD-endopeptidase MepM/ murein hydrolase activator NlpD